MPVDHWNCLARCLPFNLNRRDKNSLPLVNEDSASGANTLQRPSLATTQSDLERLSHDVNLAVIESTKSTIATEPAAICPEQTPSSHTRDASLVQQTTPASHDATPVWNSVETETRHSGSSVVDEPKLSSSDLEVESQEDYISLDQCQSGSGQQPRRNGLSIQVSSLVNDSIAASSPRSAATSSCSGDSFLLDFVPPSPCRGPVPLKSAVEYVPRYAAAAVQCNARSPDHSSGSSLGRKVYPPPLPPPARAVCAEPRSSSPVIVDRRIVHSPQTSPPTRQRVSTAVGGAAAAVELGNFRHFDGMPSIGMQHNHHHHQQQQQHLPPRVPPPFHFSSELGLSASPYATDGHQYYHYTNGDPGSSAVGAVNRGFVSSTTSVPHCNGDDNYNDDNDDEQDPEFAFLRSQAPPIPIKERHTGGSRLTNRSIEFSNSPGSCRTNYCNLDDQLDAVYVSEDRMHNPHRKTSAPIWSHSDTGAAAAAASNALENYENMTSLPAAAAAANDVGRSSVTSRLMSSSPNLSQSASELHMTPPAPHLPMSQVRVHRYVNAAAVQVDPAGSNPPSRNVPIEVLPPKMTTSPLSNTRTIHARRMDRRNKNTWTLPGQTAQEPLTWSYGSEYTDMKKYSRHRSAVETCHNINAAKRRAQTLNQTVSLDISLPTRKKIGFDGSGSSTDDDDDDVHSVASEFSSGTADSAYLDRPAALTLPPRSRRVPAESEGDVNYAVLALLEESNVENHQLRSRSDVRPTVPSHHCTSGNGTHWSGVTRTPILSTNSGSVISTRSDLDDDKTTVYNVIDWEKTEAFNHLRRELENNRHCSSVISSDGGGASTGGGTYVGAR